MEIARKKNISISWIRQSILFPLELSIVLCFISIFIYIISGGFTYPYIRISSSYIEVHDFYRPLVIMLALTGIVELLKYIWGLRMRRLALQNPAYYLIGILILYNSILIPLVLFKYYSFGLRFPEDHASINQALFNTIHGRSLAVTCSGYIFNNWNILGDHFTPILLLLVPFYYLWQDAGVLLIIQVLVISIGAVPIYFIARDRLKNEWIGVLISTVYLLYPLFTKSVFCEFRVDYLAMVFLFFAFWNLERKRYLLLLLFILLSLLCKENVFIATILIGLYILFLRDLKGRTYLGLTIAAVGILYGALVLGYFMPHFWKYTITGVYSYKFYNLKEAFLSGGLSLKHITDSIAVVASHLIAMIRDLGYVAVFSPVLILAAGSFIENIAGCISHGTHYILEHDWHSALFMPFIFTAYIYGIGNLLILSSRFFKQKKGLEAVFLAYMIGVPLLTGFFNFNNEIIQPFVDNKLSISCKPDYYSSFSRAYKQIPQSGYLLPSLPIAANLSSRRELLISVNYTKREKPEYLFMSTLKDPGIVDKRVFNELLAGGEYAEFYRTEGFLLYAIKKNVIKVTGQVFNFSNRGFMSEWEFNPNSVTYKYSNGRGGLSIPVYFDGNEVEDEFVQIRKRIPEGIDVNKYPYLEMVFKIEDPSVQFIEVALGVDVDEDGNIDRFITGLYKEDVKKGRYDIYRLNVYDLLKRLYPDKEGFRVHQIELYPHKKWYLDCSGIHRKDWYRFWIKNVRFFSLRYNETE